MDRSGSTSQPPSSRGESLFLEWLARQAGGDDEGFEVLCREHPELQAELRSLRVMHRRLLQVIQEAGGAESLSRQLASHFGSRVDPRVTLEPEERAQSGASAEVLSRLAGRGPASTRYRIKGEVAHGGMGAVLRVWDEDLRRHLAMKVMLGKAPLETTGQTPPVDQRLLARFLEEAQVTGQLDHPGIVPVHELGLDAQGHVYFTMKLVRGRTLKEVFDEFAAGQGGWTQTRLLGLLQKICEAMSYAHDKGVIHRDLKPANVMIGRYGEVYVMDWGLARIREREDHRDIRIREDSVALTSELRSDRQDLADSGSDSPLYTMDGDVVGTPAYMPPEQARGEQAAMGPHSDVYALGAMLYHLLAGHMPYVRPGERTSNYAVWRWVREGPPADLALEAPGAPGELVAICERAMAREVHARYADMAALSADLSAFIEGRVVRTYETGAYAEARKWVRRNRGLAGALAAAVIAVLVGAVAFALKARDATQAATLAQLNEQEANEQRDIAVAETAKVLRLSDGRLVSELNAEAEELGFAGVMSGPLVRSSYRAGRLYPSALDAREGSTPWATASTAR